jgi:uncharacterized protein YneF (UPF0154 family)
MPEQLTKHPEVTLAVLRSSLAKCGEGASQDILRGCPSDRFCKLPGGEICVYGLPDAPRMTQFTAADWRQLASLAPVDTAPAPQPLVGQPLLFTGTGLLIGVAIGFVAARLMQARRARSGAA